METLYLSLYIYFVIKFIFVVSKTNCAKKIDRKIERIVSLWEEWYWYKVPVTVRTRTCDIPHGTVPIPTLRPDDPRAYSQVVKHELFEHTLSIIIICKLSLYWFFNTFNRVKGWASSDNRSFCLQLKAWFIRVRINNHALLRLDVRYSDSDNYLKYNVSRTLKSGTFITTVRLKW